MTHYDTSAKAFLAERKLNGSLVLKMTAEEQKALNRDFLFWRRARELANLVQE